MHLCVTVSVRPSVLASSFFLFHAIWSLQSSLQQSNNIMFSNLQLSRVAALNERKSKAQRASDRHTIDAFSKAISNYCRSHLNCVRFRSEWSHIHLLRTLPCCRCYHFFQVVPSQATPSIHRAIDRHTARTTANASKQKNCITLLFLYNICLRIELDFLYAPSQPIELFRWMFIMGWVSARGEPFALHNKYISLFNSCRS